MLIAKLFVQTEVRDTSSGVRYTLGVVCRGEENKTWAAATPSGSFEGPDLDGTLGAVLAKKREGTVTNPEVYCKMSADPEGLWKFVKCEHSYNGVLVEFRLDGFHPKYQWGKLMMTVNNTDATKVLREQFAASLLAGEPGRWSVAFEDCAS